MSSEPLVRLQGEVYYLPRILLPAGCKLTVTLSDISLADVLAPVIDVSETHITSQVPLPFELGYAADRYPIQGRSYALSARIEHDGKLIWINDTVHPVELTNQDQSGLKIKVIQAAG
ncbi:MULTISPECIES: YbaY family lipoprotein [Pseudomonas]|uniref:Putative lipoprotein n=1 Tax=Pseudomonas syringae pv. aceris TaxID=199198 RepID=A0A0L8IT30_PSESX|nr:MULTISPECIES: YbaY family lipoprotein [Pseudomonas]AKF44915.1 Type III secretion system lipoprotein chaperone (YscW) [Pseudomonas syringae pv. syringae B301D]EGH69042.1 putative lipoprotein [Pseudomonas syringae pv. aceris str. M302273]EXL30313.1 Lipoprotein-related protein, YcsW superfamily [Pseudomonas syringae pv. syringae str. B301D-R]KOG04667.1 putative lipoprotein [Pseudomonas syringae pv. aceris]KPW10140.1 putative lipoprotein [Pseudomonas syringae pv. aceris]